MKIKPLHYLASLCVVLMSFTAQAQSKVAHIDFQKLVSEMPEVIAAQEEIQKLEKDYTNEIEAYSADAENQTDLTNQKRQQELAGMEQNIQQFRQTALQDVQTKQADMLRPLIEKARTTVQSVAKAQGFDYVLDASQGSPVIMSEGKDLMADVKKELGI
jgi:outer membrane protein